MDLQKKFSESEQKVQEKSEKITELCDKDLFKNMEILETESQILERIHSEKKNELTDIQKYAGSLYQ